MSVAIIIDENSKGNLRAWKVSLTIEKKDEPRDKSRACWSPCIDSWCMEVGEFA